MYKRQEEEEENEGEERMWRREEDEQEGLYSPTFFDIAAMGSTPRALDRQEESISRDRTGRASMQGLVFKT